MVKMAYLRRVSSVRNWSFRTQVDLYPVDSSIKLSWELIYFKLIWEGWGGGLFNLEKTMVSVLHKELKFKVEKLMYKKC